MSIRRARSASRSASRSAGRNNAGRHTASSHKQIIVKGRKARNAGHQWTKEDDRTIQQLVRKNIPTTKIAFELGRTPEAVRSHAGRVGISLR